MDQFDQKRFKLDSFSRQLHISIRNILTAKNKQIF